MKIKSFRDPQFREYHEALLREICLYTRNCADCYDEESHHCDCDPLRLVDVFNVTVLSFCMEPFSNGKQNQKLAKLADKYGYSMSYIEEEDGCWLKFHK